MNKIDELRKVIEFVNTEIGIYDTEKAEIDNLINEIEAEQCNMHVVGVTSCEHTGDEVLHQGNGFTYKTCKDCGEDI